MHRQRLFFIFLLLICGITAPSEAQRVGVTGVFMGTVTTPSGAPVSHAQILVVPADQALSVARQHRHRTDQDGTFRLRLPVGEYWVQVVAVGFVPKWYEDANWRGEALPVVISEPGVEVVWPVVVTPIASVSGRVIDRATGQAIDLGEVRVEGVTTRLQKRVLVRDGQFTIEGLFSGVYRIQVLVAGYVSGQVDVTLSDGDVVGPIEMALSKGLSVSGRVGAKSGEALDGAVVTARPVEHKGRWQQTTTLADGTFQLTGLVPGAYTFDAHKVGFTNEFYNGRQNKANASVVQLKADQSLTNINFVLGQVGAIVGRISNAQNEPLVGARIVAEPLGEGQRQQTRADRDGNYVLALANKGAYRVRAFADGYVASFYENAQTSQEATPVRVTDGTHTDPVNFVLLPGGKIAGVVRNVETQKPIRDAWVTARWVGHPGLWQTQTDPSGRFELDDLPNGKFVLQTQSEHYVTAFYGSVLDGEQAKKISVKAGETISNITFELMPREPGDFNGNGIIDFKDAMQLVHHVVGKKEFDSQLDLNADGDIALSDLHAFVGMRAGKIASGQGILRWQQIEQESQELIAELAIENMPLAKGFVLQVNYDADVAELLGADGTETGTFAGHSLMVQRYHGKVLIALDGEGVTPVSKQGTLARLRFRLKGEATGVPIEIETAWLFAEAGHLLPVQLPAQFMLELPPQSFRLMQNVPNPFNPATTIAFELPKAAEVDVAVYNLVGQRLRTLIKEHKAPGRYQVVWDGKDDAGRDVSSGVYFYRYRADDFWAGRRMLLVR